MPAAVSMVLEPNMVALLFAAIGVASAQTPLLDTWKTRTGLPLQPMAGVQVQPAEGGMALVGAGVSLLLAPAHEKNPLEGALKGQLAPFEQAGGKASAPVSVACTLGGAPASCLEAVVEVAPGASMRVLAAHRTGADWSAVCLQRRKASTALCDAVIEITAKE